jgi:hypothetical protein
MAAKFEPLKFFVSGFALSSVVNISIFMILNDIIIIVIIIIIIIIIKGGSAKSHTHPDNCFDIYYQTVRGLRTKRLELYEKVCSADCNIICLTETWLNDLCSDHNLLPGCYTGFRSDRASVNKTRVGGILIVFSSRVHSHKHRYYLESCDDCVWVEISNLDGLNLLIGNQYFPLTQNLKSLLTTSIFFFLENKLEYQ